MFNKVKLPSEAISQIEDGAVLMIGGFLGCGAPEVLIDALIKKGSKNLTVIANDAAAPQKSVGKLLSLGRIKRLIISHTGLNPQASQMINAPNESDRLDCIFVPQGTLIERIRASSFGLGGILTPTGIGTQAAQGKQIINVDGRDYLLEIPLKADFALIQAHRADRFGNAIYKATARNLNPIMAGAADITILSANEIVQTGTIDPDAIETSGVLIDIVTEE
jgi:acetate CoA/acetoacetate CoA-transferase alpha subunit